MIRLTAILKKFASQGEKTGWTYIEIPSEKAQQLKPGNKKTFRVKGKLDNYSFRQVALLPMGNGGFIIAVNASMRKGIGKRMGATVEVQMELDNRPLIPPAELMTCLADEPEALAFFNQLTKGHQNYFTKWIGSARTESTKAKRIAQAINGLSRKQDFGQMLRALKSDRKNLYGI
ncbi:MAG TPA: YdeI/OmpD-associated family protein [Chitinophagales bacterium]|nr:YdeI/OmpD-associated family protein [Chitinophagales bacterium]